MILTDVQSNIKRLLEIIKEIDVPSVGEELVIIPLQYASVADVGKSISQLFVQSTRRRGRSSSASNIKIIPYERTNSLIVFAPKAQIKNFAVSWSSWIPRLPKVAAKSMFITSSTLMPKSWSRS